MWDETDAFEANGERFVDVKRGYRETYPEGRSLRVHQAWTFW